MSGGHFNYQESKLIEIEEQIHEDIKYFDTPESKKRHRICG